MASSRSRRVVKIIESSVGDLELDHNVLEDLMAYYPNIEPLLKQSASEDQVLFSFHRSKLYNWPMLLLFVAMVLLVVYVNLKVLEGAGAAPGWLRAISFLPLLVLLELLRQHFNDKTVVKANVLEAHHGMLGISYSVPVVDYTDIREIRIDQSVVARLLRFGDVSISTAGSEQTEMVIRGAPRPHEFKRLVEELRAYREQSISAAKRSQD